MISTVLFLQEKFVLKNKKSSSVVIICFHKIPYYHSNKRFFEIDIYFTLIIFLKSYNFSKIKKNILPQKNALLLYLAFSIRCASERFDCVQS